MSHEKFSYYQAILQYPRRIPVSASGAPDRSLVLITPGFVPYFLSGMSSYNTAVFSGETSPLEMVNEHDYVQPGCTIGVLAKVRFGSSGAKSLRDSEMAAIRRFPDAQTWISDFRNLSVCFCQ
jgi:hypothetical protein